MPTLDDAIHAIKTGNRAEGRQLLEEILETEETNEQIWLWLTAVVDSDEDRQVCLENVLTLDPNNEPARKGLEALKNGTFNVNEIMSEVLEEEQTSEEEPEDGMTFLDEFQLTSQLEDDELVMPSTMGGAAVKAKGASAARRKGGRRPNIRILLLVALVLIIVLALAAVAAMRLLEGGEEGIVPPPGEQPGQVAPAGSTEVPSAPVDTPTPEVTATPTATNTPDLGLPTRRPTEPPTPTSTPVVPPTPG